MNDDLRLKVAEVSAALDSPAETVNASGDAAPRYELFHAANSICSQKVRAVFAQHRLAYISHPVKLFLGQTYLPAYVRLRMIGCDHFGGALVSHHTGNTSAAGGCDGAVVPTLVDWQTGEVIVDSRRICVGLDDQMPDDDRLRPRDLAGNIDIELGIVDGLPNYQMLMGRQPAATESDATKADTGGSFSLRKVAWCDHYLGEHADEAPLVRAYTAKRAKEFSAADTLFSPEAMRAAYDTCEMALIDLERKLEQSAGDWLFGDDVTMADLFWAIELLRMKNTGVASYWESGRLPRVARYAKAGEALPAIQAAIIQWPGAMF